MPARETVEAFIAMVTAGDYVDAIEQFYAEDASMQERRRTARRPRSPDGGRAGGRCARTKSITCEKIGDALIAGDQVAIRWRFVFTQESGATQVLEEIAWQTWRGEKVAEERFFYDPAQLGR